MLKSHPRRQLPHPRYSSSGGCWGTNFIWVLDATWGLPEIHDTILHKSPKIRRQKRQPTKPRSHDSRNITIKMEMCSQYRNHSRNRYSAQFHDGLECSHWPLSRNRVLLRHRIRMSRLCWHAAVNAGKLLVRVGLIYSLNDFTRIAHRSLLRLWCACVALGY